MIQFNIKDIMHRITVKFVKACLPKAKKPFYLRPVHQLELDIHGVASKAAMYNVTTPPNTIEEGAIAFFQVALYLISDNYRIKTPLNTISVGAGGEYTGSETSLPPDVYPHPVIKASPLLRDYLKQNVKIVFDGFEDKNGYLSRVIDDATGLENSVMTKGNIINLIGKGLKHIKDPTNNTKTGIFFTPKTGAVIEGKIIPVNTQKLLKVIVPAELTSGVEYTITIVTMGSTKNNAVLKQSREIKAGFTLKAQ